MMALIAVSICTSFYFYTNSDSDMCDMSMRLAAVEGQETNMYTVQLTMAVSFAVSSILIGKISNIVDNRLLFSSSFILLASALLILDEKIALLNYLSVVFMGCSLAAVVVPTIPELIDSMKTELRIESEKQGSILT